MRKRPRSSPIRAVGRSRIPECDEDRVIVPGLELWRKFTVHAFPADMALAVAVLLTVDATAAAGSDTGGDPHVGD